MLRTLIAAFAATAALLGGASAQAGTQWSIGISLPATGVVVSNGGSYYAPASVYYEPAPVVRYAPAPRYVHRDVYYAQPAPRVVYAPVYRDHHWDHGHRHGRHHHQNHWSRGHDRHDHRDHGPRRGY